MIRVVLWDVGGPINTEVIHEAELDADIRQELEASGIHVTDEQWADANRYAVESFAPNAYEAMIWHLTGQDVHLSRNVYERVSSRSHQRGAFELRPGIGVLIAEIGSMGIPQGLAANQPLETLAILEQHGLSTHFSADTVSGRIGYRKPDPRHFLIACERLGSLPQETVMIGDRVDNDIAPANLLGITTVLFRTGRHRDQQPRSWREMPDFTVETVPALREVLLELLATKDS